MTGCGANGIKIQYSDVTICENEFNSVNSGSDGVNSDIAALADFSDDDETLVEQLPGCPIPGCQCEGRIEFMEWGSEDMTETDDSEYEDPMDRINRLYVENYNYDLFEGMTPITSTPPIRKGRRRRLLVIGGFKPIRNHPNRNRWFNQERLLMRISQMLGIR